MNDHGSLASVLSSALGWVARHVDDFDPWSGAEFDVRRARALGELAIMLYVYVEAGGDRSSREFRRLDAFLRGVQARPALRERFLHQAAEFTLSGHVYAAMRRLGHDDRAHRELLQRAASAGLVRAIPQTPERMMGVRMVLEWGGLRCAWPDWDELAERSVLSSLPDPVYLGESGTYGLTHAILFVTGFGTRVGPWPWSGDDSELRHLCAALLVASCQERHWDLLGELLLCWNCVGWEESELSRRSWRALLSSQDPDGSLTTSSQRRPHGEETQETAFFDRYHATLVLIMATAMRQRQERCREAGEPLAGGRVATASGRILDSGVGGRAASSGGDWLADAERARGWLGRLLDDACGQDRVEAASFLQLLLACWICDGVTGSGHAGFRETTERVRDELLRLGERLQRDLARTPATLKLLAGALLSTYAPGVRPLQEFLRLSAEVLNACPASDPVADLALCEKRLLLHMLGLHPMPPLLPFSDAMRSGRALSLPAEIEPLHDLLLRLGSSTAYGTETAALRTGAGDEDLARLLCGLAVHALRIDNLALGARILRTLSYVGVDDALLASSLDFLRLHQRVDGAFGFPGPVEPAGDNRGGDDLSARTQQWLPVTLHCLWALAEASPSRWRLYRSLGRR